MSIPLLELLQEKGEGHEEGRGLQEVRVLGEGNGVG